MTQSMVPSTSPVLAPASSLTRIRTRIGIILGSHGLIDVYSAIVPPILGVLEARCGLTPAQTAILLGSGSLTSGLCQPIAAWISDRLDSRLFGGLGLFIAAVCLCMIGSATTFSTLLPLYILGMIGVGIFHPIGASCIGQLAEGNGAVRSRRSLLLAWFFVFGMAGSVVGSMLSPRVTAMAGGFELLRWFMIPGLVAAVVLFLSLRRVAHRHHDHRSIQFDSADIRRRWSVMVLLYISSAMRFIVNIALIYLLLRWAQALTASANPSLAPDAVARAAAPLNGNVNAFVFGGMLIGGLGAGTLIKAGSEKWPMVFIPVLGAPCIAAIGFAGEWGGYALALAAGIGFAATVPVTLAVAQRLLPHRTSLASGLALGGAWAMAFLGPAGAEYCLSSLGLSLATTFALTGILLAIAGALCLAVPSAMLRNGVR